VTPKEIFGRKHAIVTLLRSTDTGKPKKEKRSLSAGSLTGSVEESAFNQATVRLIRRKEVDAGARKIGLLAAQALQPADREAPGVSAPHRRGPAQDRSATLRDGNRAVAGVAAAG